MKIFYIYSLNNNNININQIILPTAIEACLYISIRTSNTYLQCHDFSVLFTTEDKVFDRLLASLDDKMVYTLNPLYTDGLFHCYMLDESICYFNLSGLFCRLYSILMENPVSKQC